MEYEKHLFWEKVKRMQQEWQKEKRQRVYSYVVICVILKATGNKSG